MCEKAPYTLTTQTRKADFEVAIMLQLRNNAMIDINIPSNNDTDFFTSSDGLYNASSSMASFLSTDAAPFSLLGSDPSPALAEFFASSLETNARC